MTNVVKEKEAKDIIQQAWRNNVTNIIEKFEKIDKLIHGPYMEFTTEMLKLSRIKLGHFYAKKESYCAQRSQRSRIHWLKEGNKNTHFFHVWATSRLKKNKIEGMKDSNVIWVRDTNNICRVAWDYFHNLLKLETSNHDGNYLNYIQRYVTQNVNNMLTRQIMDNEILKAFNQIDPRKAPDDDKDISSLNDTMIVLIPKIKDPIDMTTFRPISSCRVIYKIIFKSSKNGLNKGFFIKLDMSETYDCIEWNFLKKGYFRGHAIKNTSNVVGIQVYRLLTLKDTLCYRVLSSKYFPNGDLFHPKKVDKPSYAWSSILMEAKALESGFGWRDCPRCGASVETLIHALKDCPTARAILNLGGLHGKLLDKYYLYCVDWLEDVMRILDRKVVEDFIITLWNNWNNRNNFFFRGKENESQVIWDRARMLCHDF
ncbi:hypothetical protein PVK06_004741 [Gossypium arboreum]|uniref:Reverse transcriptase n=1 Tax=Gossypium arboreum TaxID=29729 RepID=A0ABR0QTQ7_GOSAR|nr:hypothetical protein PVK06_004741 [Gossypium arboreum]